MQIYQFFHISASGVRGPPVKARCENDDEAREVAQRMVRLPSESAEFWNGNRKLGTVSAAGKNEMARLVIPWDTGVLKG